jgi:hypothetical protein
MKERAKIFLRRPCKTCGKVRSYMPEAIRKRLEEVEKRMQKAQTK